MATKLELYAAASLEIGGEHIASLSQTGEVRRTLDAVYDRVVRLCLSQGSWNFALRTAQIDSNPSVEPEFGYTYAFDKPDDWLRTAGFSPDGRFNSVVGFEDEGPYWLSDIDPIFVRYVSNDNAFGLNLGAWPEAFTRFVEISLAARIIKRSSQSDMEREALRKELRLAKSQALTQDAMNEAQPKYPPTGRFVSARLGGRRGDRVGRQLIG